MKKFFLNSNAGQVVSTQQNRNDIIIGGKMIRSLTVVLVIGMLLLPVPLFAESGQRFEVGDYSLHISATKLSNKLIVTGSVIGGRSVDNLRIYCYLVDENNRTDRVIAVLKNYSNSRNFSLKKALRRNGGNRWAVSRVRIVK